MTVLQLRERLKGIAGRRICTPADSADAERALLDFARHAAGPTAGEQIAQLYLSIREGDVEYRLRRELRSASDALADAAIALRTAGSRQNAQWASESAEKARRSAAVHLSTVNDEDRPLGGLRTSPFLTRQSQKKEVRRV